MNKRHVTIVVHNVRSAHNVGSILRTADGLGINYVYLTGYTPYPKQRIDRRLPHIQEKLEARIDKTALGAQNSTNWHYQKDIIKLLTNLRATGSLVTALEQTADSEPLDEFRSTKAIVIVVGNELVGLEQQVLSLVDTKLHIPMVGKKRVFQCISSSSNSTLSSQV